MHEYAAAGVTHFEVKFLCHDLDMMRGMIRAYAADVVPRLVGSPGPRPEESRPW
jgi:hypothetical protein